MNAGAGARSSSGSRRRSGATSKETNSIHKEKTLTVQSTVKETLLSEAIEAAIDKKAYDVIVIDLAGICSFTDHFIICTGNSTRQNQAIRDSIEEKLRKQGVRPMHVEGYEQADWVLMDYIDFVVHIFSARAREFYDLERLWRAGKRRPAHELVGQRAI